jgi:ABC-2 type transport system permease protein
LPPEQQTPRGAIYDIGYQRYEGPRLGRSYAIWSLYVASVRNAFGIGRGAWTKVFVFGLITVAFLPAIVQVGVAALAPGEFELVRPEE